MHFERKGGPHHLNSGDIKGAWAFLKGGGELVAVLIDLSPFQPLCSWVNLPRIGLANRNIGIPQCWVSEYN